MTTKNQITAAFHPEYRSNIVNWEKYRRTFEAGKKFVDYYLKKFSIREDNTDFVIRKGISYCAAHAKASVIDIKNAIYQRLSEISRQGGSQIYRDTVEGKGRGIDLEGRTMTNFIGTQVLPELLALSKVGIYIDRPVFSPNASLSETREKSPYLYCYRAEDILSWTKEENQFTVLLLKDNQNVIDSNGLVIATEEQYRLLTLTDSGVSVQIFNASGYEQLGESSFLELPFIPFVVANISQSLLTDVADYQIALTNLESSDILYSLKSNFPFYTEQWNPAMQNLKSIATEPDSETGEPHRENTTDSGKEEVKVGTTQGRRYPKGMDRPGFIHPSAEPLLASIKKQGQLKQDIRKLVNLSLSNLERPSGSQAADETDEKGLEAGLSYIGLELEKVENNIAKIWSGYEKNQEVAVVKYPRKYNLKTDKQRRDEASDLNKLKQTVPSVIFQKEVSKDIAKILLEDRVSPDTIQNIESQIDEAKVLVTDHEILREDYEAGLVSGEVASLAAGYPEGDFEKAKIDHADRAARIADAQAKVSNRGVPDLQNPDDEKIDKLDRNRRGASNNE